MSQINVCVRWFFFFYNKGERGLNSSLQEFKLCSLIIDTVNSLFCKSSDIVKGVILNLVSLFYRNSGPERDISEPDGLWVTGEFLCSVQSWNGSCEITDEDLIMLFLPGFTPKPQRSVYCSVAIQRVGSLRSTAAGASRDLIICNHVTQEVAFDRWQKTLHAIELVWDEYKSGSPEQREESVVGWEIGIVI